MQTPIKLNCSHIFCESCINEWLDDHQTCPLCREVVPNSALNIKNASPDHFFLEFF